MAYTLFQPQGTPLRAAVSVDGWRLEVRFAPGAGTAPGGGANLPAHELSHVVQQRSTVQASVRPAPGRLTLVGRTPTASLLPEVGDEVLVSFVSAVPRSTALYFNPKEFTIKKSVPWQPSAPADRGDVGMVRSGNYSVVPIQKGTGSLVLVFVSAADAALSRDVQAVRFG
jgi:hypothetical protein